MPVFDLVILFRRLERAQLKDALKRSANYVFEAGGTLRKMENLGFRNLPYSMKLGETKMMNAHCFVFKFDGAHERSAELKEKFKLDVDVLRARDWVCSRTIMDMHVEKAEPECNIYLDLLPAPYRPNVIALEKLAKKKKKKNKYSTKNHDDSDFQIF